ncbi:hypothetical protein ABZS66_35705 [Dactylosporangium sp. NPDC005572]|uniref:hypothetical protein n=1 Tax=Dactylosporangium sp. NPDC005572 TaxID=3156889 RepID=UPI0033A355BC
MIGGGNGRDGRAFAMPWCGRWPFLKRLELAQGVQRMLLVPDEGPVQQFTAAGLHPPLDDRVQWPDKDNVWKRTILSAAIERIEISRHPAGLATNHTPRRVESDRDFETRFERHRAEVLRQRVNVQWWA